MNPPVPFVRVSIRRRLAGLRSLGALMLVAMSAGLMVGCSTAQYPQVPENVPAAVDPNAQALQRAQALTRLAAATKSDEVYRIGINDVLDVSVYEHSDLNVSERVGADGKISLPPLGSVQAAGLTERELQLAIEKQLSDGYLKEPQVVVHVQEIKAATMGVMGAVRSPGEYSSFTPIRLADLILKAGGLASGAGDSAVITRVGSDNKADLIKVDLAGLLQRGELNYNVLMQPGDILTIEPAGSIHVTGQGIENPGTYPLNKMDLLQILDAAGGLKWEAKDSIYVVRLEGANQRKIFEASYDELREQKTTDIQLRDGDRIIVERSTPKWVLMKTGEAISKTFRFVVSGSYNLFNNRSNRNTTYVN